MFTIDEHAHLKRKAGLAMFTHGPSKIISFSDKMRVFIFHKA